MRSDDREPPYRFLIDTDYSVEFPIWFVGGPHEIEPADLPLSRALVDALRAWSAEYVSPVWERDTPSWPGDEWWARWIDLGRELAQRVLSELGEGYEVVYLNDATGQEELIHRTAS